MQPRTTAILFVLAIFLGAFVYLYEIQGETGRGEAEEASRRIFPGIEAEAIEALEFRTQDDRAFIGERRGDDWLILKPVEFPGDRINLDAIASTLANIASEETIEAAGAPEMYGLGTQARRVQFRVGTQNYTLEIGADTPVGRNVYAARESDAERVFTIPLFRARSLNRDLDSLRDRRVLRFDRTRVNRIDASWPGGTVSLEKSDAGWAIVEPQGVSGPADDKAVDDLLSDLAFLRAESFVDEDQGAFAKQPADPYFGLRLRLEGDDESERDLGIQVRKDPRAGDFVVRGGHPRTLYRVPRARIEAFPRDVFSYRFKQLSDFETSRVQSFELVFASESGASSMEPVTAHVDRVETGWQSRGEPWAVGAAAGLIAEFARLEAISVVSEHAEEESLTALGLDPPRVILRAYAAHAAGGPEEVPLEQEAGDEGPVGGTRELLAEVSLGNFDPESGIYARARGQSAIFRLDAGLAEQIPIGLEAYRSRFLALVEVELDVDPVAQPAPE